MSQQQQGTSGSGSEGGQYCTVDPNASFTRGLDLAHGAVEEIRGKMTQYDSSHPEATEKATSFTAGALDKTRDAITALRHLTEQVKCGVAEIPARGFLSALDLARGAVQGLLDRAQAYDDQVKPPFGIGISSFTIPSAEQILVGLTIVAAYATEASQKNTTDLQNLSGDLRGRMAEASTGVLDKALKPITAAAGNTVATTIDQTFHITERVNQVKDLIAKASKELDDKFGLISFVKGVDQKGSGGRISQALGSVYHAISGHGK